MSSGESGDESSGIESPGPIGTIPRAGGGGSSSSIQITPNSIDMVRHQQQDHQHLQQQIHTQNSTQQQHDDASAKGINANNMGSLLYPAAALANLPQEVLLSLVQGGHLQIHQEDGGLTKVTAIKESAVTNGRESPNEVIIKKENIE